MSKAIVFSRSLRPEWLDRTVDIYLETEDKKQVKAKINEYLAGFIASPTNLRKTREILLHAWVNVEEVQKELRDWGLKVYQECPPEERVAVHWAMLLTAFPLFKDLCCIIGKLSAIQEEITLAQITRRVYEIWGERTTLVHSIPKIMKTVRECGVLEMGKPGCYKVVKKKVANQEVILFMLYAIMKTRGRLYHNFGELAGVAEFFPFNYEVELQAFYDSPFFKVDRIGGEIVVSI